MPNVPSKKGPNTKVSFGIIIIRFLLVGLSMSIIIGIFLRVGNHLMSEYHTAHAVFSIAYDAFYFIFFGYISTFHRTIPGGFLHLILSLLVIFCFTFWRNQKTGEFPKNLLGRYVRIFLGDILLSIHIIPRIIKTYNINGDINTLRSDAKEYFNFGIWKFDYFALTKEEKTLLVEKGISDLSLFRKVNTYFRTYYDASIIAFDDNDGTKIVHIYRPKHLLADALEKLKTSDILHALGINIDHFTLDIRVGNDIHLTLTPKKLQKRIEFSDYFQSFTKDHFYFGIDNRNVVIARPISYSKANHLGIYGGTGKGKSVFSSHLLYSLYTLNPTHLVTLIDPKGDCSWADIDRISYAGDPKRIAKSIQRVSLDMTRVNDELRRVSVPNLEEYYKKVTIECRKDFMVPRWIFIEEFSYTLSIVESLGKDEYSLFIKSLKQIVSLGRSSSISLIISLQRPTVDALGGSALIKDMIMPISFGASSTMETLIFGEKTGKNLETLSIGEAVYRDGGEYKKLRSFYISTELLETLAERYPKRIPKSLSEEYYEYAKSINSFSLAESMAFGLSRTDFDRLSAEAQKNGDLVKLPNSKLVFKEN